MALERIVKRFYDELENGKIMGRKCTRCGAIEYPPFLACNICGNLDTEWVELSGNAEVLSFFMPSMMSTKPQNEVFKPYAIGAVRMEEGSEINALICGISKKNKEELKAKLPLRAKARIAPRDGYSMVVFDLVNEEE